MSPFETFEHTADVGLRVTADRLPDLFAEAGRGFLSLIVDDPDSVRGSMKSTLSLEAETIEDLLLDWLSELLFRFETEQLLFGSFDVRIEGTKLEASMRGETADPDRHRLEREVKAVTYHGLLVERRDEGWVAEIIFDI